MRDTDEFMKLELNTLYAYKNFKDHFYYFFYEDSENHLFEVAFYVGFVSRRPNWVRNETTLENATESMSNGVWHKANLREYMDWTKLYNDGSLKFDVRELDPLAKLPEDSLKTVKDYSGLFE